MTLSKQLLQSGLVAWGVSVVITTSSYGYTAISNASISQTYVLSQMPYNGSCATSIRVISSLKSSYDTSCQYVAGSNLTTSSLTLRRLDLLNLTSISFSPSISYSSIAYSYQMLELNSTTGSPAILTGNLTSTNASIYFSACGFGWYQLVITVNMNVNTPFGFLYASLPSYMNVLVDVTGVNVLTLPNNSTNASIARYQSYALYPANFSYDLDGLLNMSSLSFSFYCQQINQSLGFYDFFTLGGISDLRTAKSNNSSLNSSSCFSSTGWIYSKIAALCHNSTFFDISKMHTRSTRQVTFST